MKTIRGEIRGYVIRHPGETGEMRYILGQDPEELKAKWYEGFNPVFAIVDLDRSIVFDSEEPSEVRL